MLDEVFVFVIALAVAFLIWNRGSLPNVADAYPKREPGSAVPSVPQPPQSSHPPSTHPTSAKSKSTSPASSSSISPGSLCAALTSFRFGDQDDSFQGYEVADYQHDCRMINRRMTLLGQSHTNVGEILSDLRIAVRRLSVFGEELARLSGSSGSSDEFDRERLRVDRMMSHQVTCCSGERRSIGMQFQQGRKKRLFTK